jgi:PAS domain S-box-containing protein
MPSTSFRRIATLTLLVAGAVVAACAGAALASEPLRPWAVAVAAVVAVAVPPWLALARRALRDAATLAKLEASEAHYRMILASAPIIVLTVDATGIITFVDGQGLKALGFAPAQLVGRPAAGVYPDLPAIRDAIRIAQQGRPANTIARLGPISLESWSTPLTDRDGRPAGFLAVAIDITERKRVEDALRENGSKYRELMEQASDGILIAGTDWRVIEVNTRACEMLGYGQSELLNMALGDLILPGQPGDEPLPGEGALARGTLLRECRLRCRDGSAIDVEIGAKRIGGTRIQAIVRDITERKRAEAALRASEERFRQLYNKTPAMLHSIDPGGRIVSVSDAWLERLGYAREEVLGRRSVEFLTPESRRLAEDERLPRLFQRGWSKDSPYQIVAKNGKIIDILISSVVVRNEYGDPISTLAVVTDVTERRLTEQALLRSQEQLRHSQKMEAIGRLAGGMAHDFNNLLTAIIGYGEMLRRQLAGHDQARVHAEGILKVANRGSTLTRQLLLFSRKQVLAPTLLDLSVVIVDLAPMLRRLIGEDIELVTDDLAPDATIMADQNQIGQVLMNLAVNARDAMPKGGRLMIATRVLHLDQARDDVAPGDYVQLTVQDNGHGMSEEVLSHLFEPFFTTKDPGTGTGLGLSIIYGIVKQSRGGISVTSKPGQGATFSVLLPRHPGEVAPEVSRTPSRGVTIGAETIMLAEDEDEIRNLLGELLAERGYRVIAATSGDDALRIYQETKPVLDLLLTDVVMPRMGGRELAEQLRLRQPGLKVLFMSGYTGTSADIENLRTPDMGFLPKPFTHGELLKKIRAMLGS